MRVKIVLASELNGKVRNQMADIFAEGFFEWLKYFSKDKSKLSKAFAHMFILNQFYVAMINGNVIGFVGFNEMNSATVKLQFKHLRKHLGLINGTVAYIVLKKEFENKVYPLEFNSNCGSLEFVAISSKYRGSGIGQDIIKYIFTTTKYEEYILEVADTNLPAVSLYRKLDFKEIKRIATKNAKKSGVNYYCYMKYTKQK